MHAVHAFIACSDLAGYARFAKTQSEEDLFGLLSDYYEFIGDIIHPAGGKVIKFMGDASLMFFPETEVDAGTLALLSLQQNGDDFLAAREVPCRHHLRAHFGKVLMGSLGTKEEKRLDILGAEVNTLFLIKTSGFALTAEAFRKLAPETRKHFKKHTPPVSYIPLAQAHRD